MTTFHNYTPPKYVVKKNEDDAVMVLEDRLNHFMQWLAKEKGIWLINHKNVIDKDTMHRFIEEYVNS